MNNYYIWKIRGDIKDLIRVCPCHGSAKRYLSEQTGMEIKNIRLGVYMDNSIPFQMEYLITSTLRWKTKDREFMENLIEEANKPKHLRFTGFKYKFEACEELPESIVTKNK